MPYRNKKQPRVDSPSKVTHENEGQGVGFYGDYTPLVMAPETGASSEVTAIPSSDFSTFRALEALGSTRKRCPECKATRFIRQPLVEVDSLGNCCEIGAPELLCVGCRILWRDYRQLDDYLEAEPMNFDSAAIFDARLAAEAEAARAAGRPVVENLEN